MLAVAWVPQAKTFRRPWGDFGHAASDELKMWEVEAQIITRDGQAIWTHAIARPRRKPEGSVLWDGVILDATRIKKAEFELRTPLDAIIGFSDNMTQETSTPVGSAKFREYAKDINDAGQHLLFFINDILDLSKI